MTLKSQGELTRAQVAERLGISTSSVRRLEDDLLHPEEDENGVWRFDAAEVEAVRAMAPIRGRAARVAISRADKAAARTGRIAAVVFGMFARGRSLPDIVVRTKQPPSRVRALYHEWVTSLDRGEFNR